eukprot:scaffold50397_cov517-Isochrysis_galbana.AAC.1
MAAWLPIYSSASSPQRICDLLPSTGAIEQQRQRRTRRQPSRQILFLLCAPKGILFFTYSPVSG